MRGEVGVMLLGGAPRGGGERRRTAIEVIDGELSGHDNEGRSQQQPER